MATTINTIPARQAVTIQQGSPWPGVRVRTLDNDGEPLDPQPTYTGQLRTNTIDNGGVLIASCDVTADGDDGYYAITFDGNTTRDFPVRELYLDVDAELTPSDPSVILKLIVQVEGEINSV